MQAFSWCQDIRKIETRNARQREAADRAQRARGRLPRSTAAGDDTLRNRIELMEEEGAVGELEEEEEGAVDEWEEEGAVESRHWRV